jgi:hypothetical protein
VCCRTSLQQLRKPFIGGTQGEVLAKKASLGPVPLTRFVAGDSARSYALVYEQNARRAVKSRTEREAWALWGSPLSDVDVIRNNRSLGRN